MRESKSVRSEIIRRYRLVGASIALAVSAVSAVGQPSAVPADRPSTDVVFTQTLDQRYRIVGKASLALFSVTRDVGSACLTLRSEHGRTVMTLLAGSDPQRAPRRLNQWTYLREETDGERTGVFALRTSDDESVVLPVSAEDEAAFSVSCALITPGGATTALTTVPGQGLTYRMLPQVLDRLPAPSSWKQKQTSPPDGTRRGFLTALRSALEQEHAGADLGRRRPTPYVHNDIFYELSVRSRRDLGKTVVGTRTYNQLKRAEFGIRNQRTNAVTKFAVTYDPYGEVAALPIQIVFHPRFWLTVELRRDETADPPPAAVTFASCPSSPHRADCRGYFEACPRVDVREAHSRFVMRARATNAATPVPSTSSILAGSCT